MKPDLQEMPLIEIFWRPVVLVIGILILGYWLKVGLALVHWLVERGEKPFMVIWEELYADFWWFRKRKHTED